MQSPSSITDPFRSGQTLSIKATGNFTEKIEEGAYLLLVVKYGLIRLINQKADLCEQMKNAVDEDCPLIGEKIITKDVDLPKQIPSVSDNLLCSVASQC